ncbi:hypothetical protein K502DRAFT_209801 [Neoconidiobolus thromboides FSU 785]|nr:hypothetical protein K502DRAFT_209801 [Neoconidiobolus thromboides FSU 785]
MDSSRSSYGKILFKSGFFDEIKMGTNSEVNCKVDLKTLLDVVKLSMSSTDKAERCEFSINDFENKEESEGLRLKIRFIYPNLVYQQIKVPYQDSAVETLHIVRSNNCYNWRMNSKFLLTLLAQFDIRLEEFTLICTSDSFSIKSFHNEALGSITDLKKIKKHPHTILTIHPSDLDRFNVDKDVYLTLNVKEFKAVLVLAKEMECDINAYFTCGGEPIFFDLELRGTVQARFVICTSGEQNIKLFHTQNNSNLNSSFIATPATQEASGKRDLAENVTQNSNVNVLSTSLSDLEIHAYNRSSGMAPINELTSSLDSALDLPNPIEQEHNHETNLTRGTGEKLSLKKRKTIATTERNSHRTNTTISVGTQRTATTVPANSDRIASTIQTNSYRTATTLQANSNRTVATVLANSVITATTLSANSYPAERKQNYSVNSSEDNSSTFDTPPREEKENYTQGVLECPQGAGSNLERLTSNWVPDQIDTFKGQLIGDDENDPSFIPGTPPQASSSSDVI